MSLFVQEESLPENNLTFLYSAASQQELQNEIERVMIERKYKIIGLDLYERGNGVLRILLGAFYKHFKMEVAIEVIAEQQFRIAINKKSSGFAGGIIGVNQVQKELLQLRELFKSI